MEQLNLFNDTRPPGSVSWNLWHGCTKVSAGCQHCYMFRRDEMVGRDPTKVEKTAAFDLPVRTFRSGRYKGLYNVPSGSRIFTCFSSDFFHPAADGWRDEAWDMIRERSDCSFFMITKRPERIAAHTPPGMMNEGEKEGWAHVTVAVTCEDQKAAERRLPLYLSLPLCHHQVMIEPMLSAVDLTPYFRAYPGVIESVSVGGESGAGARVCRFEWVTDVRRQCADNDAGFFYHQTGAVLIKDGKEYRIPRKLQHSQARKAGLDIQV